MRAALGELAVHDTDGQGAPKSRVSARIAAVGRAIRHGRGWGIGSASGIVEGSEGGLGA